MIALFNWRDLRHPAAGGAEVYTDAFLRVLVSLGYECVLLCASSEGLPAQERHPSGYTILRMGSQLSCRLHAARWLRDNRNAVDLAIDEVNTLPWLSPLVVPRRSALLIHQLAREVWWAEAPRAAAAVGFVLEPAMLQIYRRTPVIALSCSTAHSLRRIGLRGNIQTIEPALAPPSTMLTEPQPWRIGYLGRLARSKRIDHIVRAVEIICRNHPQTRLAVVGGGADAEIERLKCLARELGIESHIDFLGRLSESGRDEVLAHLDILAMTSLREGWGLVVSEAARFRVPSVAYDVPGLRDSIEDGKTGLLVRPQTPEALAAAIQSILSDRTLRNRLGEGAADLLHRYSQARFENRVAATITALLSRNGRM